MVPPAISKNRSGRETDGEHGELETRFRTLVEQIPAIVYIWSVNGVESPARLFSGCHFLGK
jgi:hypothetical protein